MKLNYYTFLFLFAFLLLFLGCAEYTVEKNRVTFDGYSFKVLADGLINIQKGKYEEGSFNYNDSGVLFGVEQHGDELRISTESFTLFYKKGTGDIAERIELKFKKGEQTIRTDINHEDKQNLGGLIKSVDRCDGRLEYETYDLTSDATPLKIPNGLLSSRGWTVLKNIDNKLLHADTDTTGREFFVFCYGNDYKKALQDFVNLNGKVPMLPKWSLGTWFSRYQPLAADDYKQIVARFRKEKIPLDVILPDMNWHVDGWFGTRYDVEKFPDMKGFFKWAEESGLRVGFNHHPGAVWRDEPKAKTFIKSLGMDYDSLVVETDKLIANNPWDGFVNTLFYGEHNPAHIKPHFETFLAPIMDEGLTFHWVDGTPSVENLEQYYSLTENKLNERAIVLTRQEPGSFDHHKYPLGFSADTYISWESLKFNTELTVTGANVGVYWSHDIGGHMERYPELDHNELFARWVQAGAMSPTCRLHATGGVDWDTRKAHVRKPWEWNAKVLDATRKILQLKYKLMPYLYTLNRKAHETGVLICRGMYIDFPEYANAYKYASDQYMYGPDILVAPITAAAGDATGIDGIANKNVWIPEGKWYDYFTGEAISGPVETLVEKPIDQMPLFVKAGAILPMMEYMEHTNQKRLDNLTIEFYQPAKAMENSFVLYEDDGISLDYRQNEFAETKILYGFSTDARTEVNIEPMRGNYNGCVEERAYTLVFKHLSGKPDGLMLNGKKVPETALKYKDGQLEITTGKLNVRKVLTVSFQTKHVAD